MGLLTQFSKTACRRGRLGRPFLFGLAACLAACALPAPQQRVETAYRIAAEQGWRAEKMRAGRFDFQVFLPQQSAERLVVYVEGDGLAWLDATTPSADPTPVNPLALRLAARHPGRHAAYLGRPCQYDPENVARNCRKADWTGGRFSAEIVEAANRALDGMKARVGAKQITLVGYSGGGALAALMAARRSDVEQLVTVAAVLDHRGWTEQLGLTPLSASLNPVDDWERLRSLRQVHLLGEEDKVTGQLAVQGYVSRAQPGDPISVRTINGFSHACCWVEAWPKLWRELSGEAVLR